MKFYFYVIGLFAFCALFASCSDDNFDTTETETEEPDVKQTNAQNSIMTRASTANDESTYLIFDCISLKYPFELIDLDGNNILVSSDEEYDLVVFDSLVIDFNYPLVLIDSDGEDITVTDASEFAELFAACIPDNIWDDSRFPAYFIDEANECYSLVYPLSVQNEDGENNEIADQDDLLEAITKENVFFNYPFNLITNDGEEFSISSIDDFYDAIFNCNGINTDSLDLSWEDGFEYLGCYKLEFPISIVDVEGNTLEVATHEILCELMIEGKILDFTYPLNLISEDGETTIADSKEELEQLLNSCYGVVSFYGDALSLLLEGTSAKMEDACYSIDYPITIINPDSTSLTESVEINSDDELIVYEYDGYELDYPINVTYADGNTATISQYEDLFVVTITCAAPGTSVGALLEFSDCFDISFPINVTVYDSINYEETGTWEKVETYNTVEDLVRDMEKIFDVEFPFTVILKSDGKEEEINGLEELSVLTEGC